MGMVLVMWRREVRMRAVMATLLYLEASHVSVPFYRDLDTLPDTEGEFLRLFVHLGFRILKVSGPKKCISMAKS